MTCDHLGDFCFFKCEKYLGYWNSLKGLISSNIFFSYAEVRNQTHDSMLKAQNIYLSCHIMLVEQCTHSFKNWIGNWPSQDIRALGQGSNQ